MGDVVEIRLQNKQEMFSASPADIAIFGGSAGGGKTYALLLEPLRHINKKNFGAVFFRRIYPELTREGGAWDEAGNIYPLFGGEPNQTDLVYRFPSGAKVTFAHLQLEKTKDSWRGAQIPLICFDQLETFTESQFFYMQSRNRSARSGVRSYMRCTCNPEPGWLANFLSWWIAEDGFADLGRAGKLRWFVRPGNEIIWADAPEELAKYNTGDLQPKSVTFIPSTIYDNPALLSADPGYLASLNALPYVDRARLLGDPRRGGNWKIKPEAGKIFNRGWFEIVPAAPVEGGVEVFYWDFAATKEEPGKDPDFTAGVHMRKVGGIYYVLNCVSFRENPAETERRFVNYTRQAAAAAKQNRIRFMARWEQEPGSAAKREKARLVQLLDGIDAGGRTPHDAKQTRWKPLSAQAEAGNVKIVAGPWNENFLNEMHGQPDLPHDDIPDAGAGAHENLSSTGWARGAAN